MLLERGNNERAHVIRQHILTAHLDDARSRCVAQSQHRSEVKIVREHNMVVR